MDDPVRFEVSFVDSANNIVGYLERSDYNTMVDRWEGRKQKPPKGVSRFTIFDLVKQLDKPPIGTVRRFELDAVVKIIGFNPPTPKKRIRLSELQGKKQMES